MRLRLLSIFLTLLLLVGLGTAIAAAMAQSPDAHAGTWDLNVGKSTYRPGPMPKSGVLTVQYTGTTRRSVFETMTADGGMTRSEYAAAEDGNYYPIKGSPNAELVSLRRTGPTTIERVDKRRGHVVLLYTMQLSQNAKTLTVTQKGVTALGDPVSNTMVFEKR